MKSKKETIDMSTGEITSPKFNEVIIREYKRPDGSIAWEQDYSNCPTMAEQHTAHLTDINYLMEKYKPDELAAYIAARNEYRQEIIGHDFSSEPSLQDAMNIVKRSRDEFEALDEELKYQFKNHLEFLKFVDNPSNAEKLIKMGLIKPKQLQTIQMENKTSEPAIDTDTKNTNEKTK